jgi:hypothetical protein
MFALQEAWEVGESWFIPVKGANDSFPRARLRPQEAATWLLGNPLYEDQVPATLRAYLEAGGLPERTALAYPDASAPLDDDKHSHRAHRGGRTREKREQVEKILLAKFPPDGQPPGGRFPKTLMNEINDNLTAQNFDPVKKDTCRRARDDLKSESRQTQLTQK